MNLGSAAAADDADDEEQKCNKKLAMNRRDTEKESRRRARIQTLTQPLPESIRNAQRQNKKKIYCLSRTQQFRG